MSRNYITKGHFREISRQIEETLDSLLPIFPRKKDYQMSEQDFRTLASSYKKLNIWTGFVREEFHESNFSCLESILESLSRLLVREGISIDDD